MTISYRYITNAKNVLLGVFVNLTIIFASSTLIVYGQNTTLTTRTTTETSTSATTLTVTSGQLLPANDSFLYLSASSVCGGPGGIAPCWGGDDAYIFTCASAAATPQGCTQQVNSTLTSPPLSSYKINIRYPFANQTTQEWNQVGSSIVNCLWTVQGDYPGQGYAHCVSIGLTSFIIGVYQPGGIP
jgi:hypothetical protein